MAASESTEREVRAARNQTLFRTLNEKMNSLNDAFAPLTGVFTIVCECADTGCAATFDVDPGEYAAVRGNPRTFIVLREHVVPDVERIVRVAAGHVVVEKEGAAGDLAEALDADLKRELAS